MTKSAACLTLMAILVCLPCWSARGDEQPPTAAAQCAGQPADIAPSAYQYRADRQADKNPPESWIALMKYANLPFDRAVDVNAPSVKQVLCGLIWEEVRRVRRVTLTWQDPRGPRPKPDEIVLAYFDAEAQGHIPTWWNPTVVREADPPTVSADGRTYTFSIPSDTFGLVVCGRGPYEAAACEVPVLQAFTSDVWKHIDLEIEWGFDPAAAECDYSGRVEAYDGRRGWFAAIGGRCRARQSRGRDRWRATAHRDGRRGVSMRLLYLGTSPSRETWPYNAGPDDVARTIVTVWTQAGGFSFLASDLEQGPILAPEYGFFVRTVTPPLATPLKTEPTASTRARVSEAAGGSRPSDDSTACARPRRTNVGGAVDAMFPRQTLPAIPPPERGKPDDRGGSLRETVGPMEPRRMAHGAACCGE